ncbi:MAG: SpoIIE family protein phosphatase [Clostridia bacterium]|nr:SpoIIE family protein phosphatase [Clostridia bacterium]
MLEGTNIFFSKMVGTLAVILVVAAFIGGSELLIKFTDEKRAWKYSIIAGVLGGVFGVYGNISGVSFNGAVISVRDIGPMLAGFTGGPIGGLIAGLVSGLHRLFMGGITAQACVVATCSIGLICGFISQKYRKIVEKPGWAVVIGSVMEAFHLSIVLAMVKPFETALDIVRHIAIPFILVNAIGFTMMITIITYTERQRKLTLERSRLQSELEVANVIQHSLLPVINESYPGREEIDVSAFMEAAKEVGGDFYDTFFVDKNHIAFVIGDVSGKGVPAALFMASSKIILQNCIRDIPDLSEAIGTANHVLCERNEADMFVTVWAGVLDLTTLELEYISAGHNPPVHISNGKAEFFKTKNGFVLAGMDGVKYKKYTVQLNRGDTIILYTDGIVEAETEKHELFGDDRLIACLDGKGGSSAASITELVKNSVNAFVDGNSQFDDMTLLCFKIN